MNHASLEPSSAFMPSHRTGDSPLVMAGAPRMRPARWTGGRTTTAGDGGATGAAVAARTAAAGGGASRHPRRGAARAGRGGGLHWLRRCRRTVVVDPTPAPEPHVAA